MKPRRPLAAALATTVAVVALAAACVGNGKTPRIDHIEPLPAPMVLEENLPPMPAPLPALEPQVYQSPVSGPAFASPASWQPAARPVHKKGCNCGK